MLTGEGGARGDELGGRALKDDLPAVVAGAGAEVDDPVGVRHDRLVVGDDDDRLAGVHEPVEPAPIRTWSTTIAVVSPSSTSTSGRATVGMKPCTKALYVSLISRCDSAAIVSNTSELLPDPETPVKTVSRRFGISTLTSLRLFSRAPCTRITS
ncbi:MAG TPA: hypothetical protein VNX67_02500 [Solirubrobacteraceae bacterium]|nr:hypothetical protein [Solirubrobacteraceae bacterium]